MSSAVMLANTAHFGGFHVAHGLLQAVSFPARKLVQALVLARLLLSHHEY